ncbi:UDP-N-acetylmuramoyl-L-alanyl-D-glutamate--2,6-diaminopimelate ligase [Pseudoglutamicibacter cumminsii]|uniref:UDP-N-acetylmuramoyl-L-alanyl-D-glutamate--2, 6-diaminopimelate ligase n=1 Tax=Pseudoglutamicibacter cumminsii TaxID=156979 RepID=UPI003A0FD2D1
MVRKPVSHTPNSAAQAEQAFRPKHSTGATLATLFSQAELVANTAGLAPEAAETRVTGVTLDSRAVQPGDLYAALPGAKTHGARYAIQAINAGAAAIVTDATGAEIIRAELAGTDGASTPIVVTENLRTRLGDLAAAIYSGGHQGGGNGRQLPALIGVTGTNGKTTTTYMVRSLLNATGHNTGLIGTIEIQSGNETIEAKLTTPEATQLHALRARMSESGVDTIAMEVSSHAIEFHRISGLLYDVVGFTNLTQDHLDLHGSMEEYFNVKAQLFTPEHARTGVVLVDDTWGKKLAETAGIPVQTLSVAGNEADWTVSDIRREHLGYRFTLSGPADDAGAPQTLDAHVDMPGEFNIANAALALVMVIASGVPVARLQEAIASEAAPLTPSVPGRMEVVSTRPAVIVDFAHNPDALERALASVRTGEGRVIVVFGATGERDQLKRPIMGRIAAENADVVIVSDDDPHDEDPAAIRAAVLEGAHEAAATTGATVLEAAPRANAIHQAVHMAGADDVVLLAGRGHETAQDVSGTLVPIDDREEARAALTQQSTRTE